MRSTRATWCAVLLVGLFFLWAWIGLDGLELLDRSASIAPIVLTSCCVLGILLAGIGVIGLVTATRPEPPVPLPAAAVRDSLALGWDPEGGWIRLSNEAQQRHTLVLGSSGSGKTRSS